MNTTPRQIGLKYGRLLRDVGMDQVELPDGALDYSETLTAIAVAMLEAGHQVTSEDVRDAAPPPPDGVDMRVMGPAIRRAIKRTGAKRIGYTASARPDNHCSPMAIWKVSGHG